MFMSVQARGVVELVDEFMASEFECKAGNMLRSEAAMSKSMPMTTVKMKVGYAEYCQIEGKYVRLQLVCRTSVATSLTAAAN